MISAQILHDSKTKWRVAPERKTGAAAKHLLKQTADCTALQSQMTMEPWNPGMGHTTAIWRFPARINILLFLAPARLSNIVTKAHATIRLEIKLVQIWDFLGPRPFMESVQALLSFHLQHTFGGHLCTSWSGCFCQCFRPGSSGKPGWKTFHKRGPIIVLSLLWNVLNISFSLRSRRLEVVGTLPSACYAGYISFHSLQVSVPILTLFVLSEKDNLNSPMVASVKPYALSFSVSPVRAGVANRRLLISLLIIPLLPSFNDFFQSSTSLISVVRQMLCAEGLYS